MQLLQTTAGLQSMQMPGESLQGAHLSKARYSGRRSARLLRLSAVCCMWVPWMLNLCSRGASNTAGRGPLPAHARTSAQL